MKGAIAIFVVFFAAVTLARPNEEKYTDRYDNIDVDELLSNDNILKGYFECLVDRGKCTPDGKELKGKLPEALGNGCAKCTEKQKQGTKRIISYLINNKEEYWNELCAKYDPERKYAQKYEKELREVKGHTI